MNSVISSGQALLKNWGQNVRPAQGTSTRRPAQGTSTRRPAQGNPAMAPKKRAPSRSPPSDGEPARRRTGKQAEAPADPVAPARRVPSRSPPSEGESRAGKQAEDWAAPVAPARRVPSRSPPSEGESARRTGRVQAEAAAPAVAPVLAIATAPGPRFKDPAKREPGVKQEAAEAKAAAPPAAPAAEAKAAAPPAAPGAEAKATAPLAAPAAAAKAFAPGPPLDTSVAPPSGEMQRMASALSRAASRSDEAQGELDKYKLLSNKEKRNYYYNTFLPANPMKDPSRLYTRSRQSERVDGTDTEDFGWVDRDFIAGKLHLDNWREVPEKKIKLEFHLAKYPKRECEAAHLLEDWMDKYEYMFSLTVAKSSEKNKKSVTVQEASELDEATHSSAMAAIDGLDGGRALSGPPKTVRGQKRQLSPEDESKKDPAWLSTYKKECIRNFSTQKRAAEQAISSADECVRLVEQNERILAGNDLLKAYLQTVKQQVEVLRKADQKAATFEVAHSSTKLPASEDVAKKYEKAWKDAANEVKAAKTTFTSACLKMQTDLRAALAKA